MTVIRGVGDSQARARQSRAVRELAQWQRDEAERVERVCAALRQIPGLSDEFKAQIAHTIIDHPVHLFGKGKSHDNAANHHTTRA
jgi:thioester reductase-like protein